MQRNWFYHFQSGFELFQYNYSFVLGYLGLCSLIEVLLLSILSCEDALLVGIVSTPLAGSLSFSVTASNLVLIKTLGTVSINTIQVPYRQNLSQYKMVYYIQSRMFVGYSKSNFVHNVPSCADLALSVSNCCCRSLMVFW